MLESILDSLKVVALATKTNFRSVTSREVALFEGPMGWGEFSPFLEYGFEESVPWLLSGIEAAYAETPLAHRSSIEVNATLPAIDDRSEIQKLLDSFEGVETVKIKVGGEPELDLARINFVRYLHPETKIRIDVNGLWSVKQAHEFLSQVGQIEYVEQPCATIEELRELKHLTGVKIVGDEIIRKAQDPFSLELSGAVDIIMLKVAPLGGISRALEIAKHYALPVVVSSALESAIGISHGLKLAAAIPQLNYACGLGTGALLREDVGNHPIVGGKIEVNELNPDPAALHKYAVSQERLNWWKNRIRMVWNSGAEQSAIESGWSA